jgi:hypothetical protein
MKARYPFTLVLLGAAVASGQTIVQTEAPTGITVIKYSWRNETRPAGWDQPMLSASESGVENPIASVAPLPDRHANAVQPPGVTPQRRPGETTRERRTTRRAEALEQPPSEAPPDRHRRVEEYSYEVKIKNEAAQAIEGVEWDYVFIEPTWGTELARHRFHSFSRGKPGKSLTLKGNSAAPPTRVISAAGAGGDGKRKLFEERIVIKCVLYADGTVRWRDSGAERDCAAIRARAQARKEGDR